MISDKEFSDFLKDGSFQFNTEEQLEKIIDGELAKNEEDMDTELVSYCLDRLRDLQNGGTLQVLTKEGEKTVKKRHIFTSARRIAVVAAVIALFTVVCGAAIGTEQGQKMFKGLVEVYENYVQVNFKDSDSNAERYKTENMTLLRRLNIEGFDDILIPSKIFDDGRYFRSLEVTRYDYLENVSIQFLNWKTDYYKISVDKYLREEDIKRIKFNYDSKRMDMVEVNGLEIFVFEQEDICVVAFRDGQYIYQIFIPEDFEDAKEFAKSFG